MLLLLLALLAPSLAQECSETQAVYPVKSAKVMTDTTAMKGCLCDMFDPPFSCCNFITEYGMKQTADTWVDVVASYTSALEIMENRKLYPGLIPPAVYSSVRTSVVYNVTLNKKAVTGLALKASGQTCTEAATQYSMITQYMQPAIDEMADTLSALIEGTEALKSAYFTITEFTLSPECTNTLIRNGVSTLSNLQNNNCQVCTSNTAAYRTCHNTCRMAVSGCYNELVDLYQLSNTLLSTIDLIYSKLDAQLQSSYFGRLGDMELEYPECFSVEETADNGVERATTRQYFSSQLKLSAVSLEEGIKYACGGSTSNSNCWTQMGVITTSDSTPAIEFTSEAQQRNLLLPRGQKDRRTTRPEVREIEAKLTSVIVKIAAYQAEPETEQTPGPSSSPATPTAADEEAVKGSGAGGLVVIGVAMVTAVLLW